MIKGFELLNYQSTREGLLSYREKGALRGVYLGFPLLHEKYTMSLPGCTDWTGVPQSGKTEFLLECLLNTTKFYGWKHLLYVPDVGSKNEILSVLIHKLSGKTFDKRYVNSNYISEEEVDRHLQWIMQYFFILVRSEMRARITPYEFWDYAVQLKKEIGLHTATIDSWKDMKHDRSMRDDQYLDDVLGYRNSLSEEHNLHFHIVIHPLKTEKDSKTGQRMPPTAYDLKGGTSWYDNGKCMVTVHRVDGFANKVDIIITKAKPKSVATLGKVEMYFDLKESKFYWEYQENKIYAKKEYFKPTGLQLNDETDDEDIPF